MLAANGCMNTQKLFNLLNRRIQIRRGIHKVLCAMADGRPVALARLVQGEIRPVRVLNV